MRDLFNNKIDIYHGLSNELPLGIEKTSIKTDRDYSRFNLYSLSLTYSVLLIEKSIIRNSNLLAIEQTKLLLLASKQSRI